MTIDEFLQYAKEARRAWERDGTPIDAKSLEGHLFDLEGPYKTNDLVVALLDMGPALYAPSVCWHCSAVMEHDDLTGDLVRDMCARLCVNCLREMVFESLECRGWVT